MEQIEASKRKTSKERYRRDLSKNKEQSSKNQKNLQRPMSKQSSSSAHKIDRHDKNKRDNASSSNSASSSELTSPISENMLNHSPLSSRQSLTRKEKKNKDHHVFGPNTIEDDVDDMLPTSRRQPQINKSNVDNSWDSTDQGERKTGIQHNQLKVYKEINYSGNCANIEDNILADDDVMREGEDIELADHQYYNLTPGKFRFHSFILSFEKKRVK